MYIIVPEHLPVGQDVQDTYSDADDPEVMSAQANVCIFPFSV